MRKYQLLGREMVDRFGNVPVDSIGIDTLAEYRETWKLAPATSRNKVERLRAFFKFCMERKWCSENPALLIKNHRVVQRQSIPFKDEEIAAIMKGVDEFPDSPAGRRKQLRAFILLLRYSGLRIQDAINFTMERISDGSMMVRTQKTGQVVWLPLPEVVLEALKGLGERPFWNGAGTIKTYMGNWERTLERLFKRASVKGSAHKFRHTFSINLLSRGVSIEDVAVLLGHSSIRITERHYSAFVKVRQDRLMEAVRRTFGPP
jgi:site-specific recombinase XerD